MANVKCGACGKRYDYYEHGCCPNCGAYNRPPYRDRVEADGTVHHISDDEFFSNTAARRRSQGGKVCFEQDECYEDQVRRSARRVRAAVKEQPSRAKNRERTGKKDPKRIIVGVVAAIMIANILPLILTMCSVSDVLDSVEDFFVTDVTPVRPEQLPEGAWYDIEVGDTFVWWDEDACVVEVLMDEREDMTTVELTVWRAEDGAPPEISYLLADGTEVIADCDSLAYDGENYYYSYVLPDRAPGTECYARFTGYNNDVFCRLRLSLAEAAGEEEAVISYASMESTFLWWDEKTVVTGADLSETGSTTELQVFVVQTGEYDEPAFLYYTEEGWENWAYCQELEDLGEGKFRYTFYVEDRMPGSDCWAVFSGYNEDTLCEVRVLMPAAENNTETPGNSGAQQAPTAGYELAEMGDTFLWWDEEASVTKASVHESGGGTDVNLTMYRSDDFDDPIIRYTTNHGGEMMSFCLESESLGQGKYHYFFHMDDRKTGTTCYAVFTGFNGGTHSEIRIPLN